VLGWGGAYMPHLRKVLPISMRRKVIETSLEAETAM
jgi:hypothetical protein